MASHLGVSIDFAKIEAFDVYPYAHARAAATSMGLETVSSCSFLARSLALSHTGSEVTVPAVLIPENS